jgi:ATP-dependent DNA helicase RecG
VELPLDVQDDDPLRNPNLRRRDAHSAGAKHRFDHSLTDPSRLFVDGVDSLSHLAKDGVTVRSDAHRIPLFGTPPHYKVVADMPQGNCAPPHAVGKVLRLERSTGFNDVAVTCGLEAFIQRNLPEAASIVAGYREAGHFERQRVVARLLERLEEGGGEPGDRPEPPDLCAPITCAQGVGRKRAESLTRLGIETVEDLLLYLPRRLEDRSRFAEIGTIRPGENVAVRAEILAVDQLRVSREMTVIKVAVGDGTGILYAVWFNQPWMTKQLRRGERIDLFGTVERSYQQLQMRTPVWEPAEAGVDIGRLVPIYPATEGISDRLLRSLIARLLDVYLPAVVAVVPGEIEVEYGLLPRRRAIEGIHRPLDGTTFEQARRSLAFEELFLLQLGLLATTRGEQGDAHSGRGDLTHSFVAGLPFSLTRAQAAALREIEADLGRPIKMMRLLQGDVGSGKTLVAIAAALRVIDAGFQVAFMVPTEILAEQHAANLARMLEGLPVRVELLTGATKGKDSIREQIEAGDTDLVVGTHALIQESVTFDALGLVIIDEQHRFGVVQRSLIEEKGNRVDLLVMSATPIPRTIALTLYGEFDVSTLDELPLGEKQVDTHWIAESRRQAAYDQVGALARQGRKGYVVLPLVEESEKVAANAAVQVAEELTARFPDVAVGLVHGRLSQADKADVMERFRSGAVQLLVSTTVIEVGIDVLDADLMVIEHADRFGLSQLHQLRGRIGRAGQPAVCLAIADAKTDEAKRRLQAFSGCEDGFAVAEEDLRIRGPGDLLGTQQHGFLTRLRAVDLIEDLDIMRQARDAARQVHSRGASDELLVHVDRRFGEVLKWLRV